MALWQILLVGGGFVLVSGVVAVIVWASRASLTPAGAVAELRALGVDLVRLPGRLRRVAADPRTPRRARWLLIVLALYVASPIDLIPDVIPGIGHLDELVIVPLVLRRIRRMVPPEVWAEHFPPRSRIADQDTGTDERVSAE